MGARQSKRSVDITTTPKKGDGEVITEGEGKLEKIGDADIKVTTNGSLPHTDLDVADKDENAKDSVAEKDTDEKVQENGVSEAEEVEIPEKQNSAEQLSETPATEDKTPDSTSESKIEETPESKKPKDKSKKKKWSFRSISFSKKDKSKPSKESEKNGDVKEVAEENAEENATSPSVDPPKVEDPKVPEAVTNGDAAGDVIAKSDETPTTVENPEKPAEEPKVEEPKAAAVEEPKILEPIVEKPAESAPSPAKEQLSPAKEQEDPQPVETPTPVVEETKEVRREEIPPPLPSSNPPSPVTVFAESTKADSLTADQVPINLPQSAPVVETIPEPSVVQSQPLTASSPVVETVSEDVAVVGTKVEPVSEKNQEKLILESVSSSESLLKENPSSKQAIELISDSLKTDLPETPESAAESSNPIEIPFEPPKSPTVVSAQPQEPEICLKYEIVPEKLPKSESSKITSECAAESSEPSEPVKLIEPDLESLQESDPISESIKKPAELSKSLLSETTESSSQGEVVAQFEEETKSESVAESPDVLKEVSNENEKVLADLGEVQPDLKNSEKPTEIIEVNPTETNDPIKSSDVPTDLPKSSEETAESPRPVEEVVEAKKSDVLNETPRDSEVSVGSPEQTTVLPVQAEKLPELSKSSDASPIECPKEPSPPSPPSFTAIQESSAPIPENISGPVVPSPESQSSTIEQLPDSVVNPADSLPDISTESLPSLPEPLSENLAEPMSLPPVDSVPEPIATDCPISKIPLPSDSTVLTNGNTNGLPSPTDEVSALLLKEGPLKQVPTETSNEVSLEEGDKETIEPVPVKAPACEE